MRNVTRAALLLIGASALAACSRDRSDQNIMVDNNVAAADADIEALPADESSATASDDLANGAIEDNTATDNLTNSY
jgi:hypothetical protein